MGEGWGRGGFPALCLSVSIPSVDPCGSVGGGLGGLCLLFEAGGWRQQPGGRARCEGCPGPASPCAEAPPPITLWGHGGRGTDVLSWQQMAGAQAQEASSSKVTSSDSQSPGNLVCGRCDAVVEAPCPAQHSQACSAASHLEEQKGGSNRLSREPRLPLAAAVAGSEAWICCSELLGGLSEPQFPQ